MSERDDETRPWRIFHSEYGYGWHLWLGRRVRINSPKSLTPMVPHVRFDHDENCNPVTAVHAWPLGGVDVWWRGMPRTEGICDECTRELDEAFG